MTTKPKCHICDIDTEFLIIGVDRYGGEHEPDLIFTCHTCTTTLVKDNYLRRLNAFESLYGIPKTPDIGSY